MVSPGGVGFDICCGVRLLSSSFSAGDFQARKLQLMSELDRRIPRGLGRGAIAGEVLLEDVLKRGAQAAL